LIPIFRFLRYEPGQQFKAHQDPTRNYVSWNNKEGIFQSRVTFALYLNDSSEFQGGNLNFLELDFSSPTKFKVTSSVVPQPGRGVLFAHSQLHEGGKTIEGTGTKYMMQCDWLYELVDYQ